MSYPFDGKISCRCFAKKNQTKQHNVMSFTEWLLHLVDTGRLLERGKCFKKDQENCKNIPFMQVYVCLSHFWSFSFFLNKHGLLKMLFSELHDK